MIPLRIKLSGFLSYRDEQEIDFEGAPLWMLAGTNGSGKSSIFDGVTYALFGHHRGGSQNAGELINKESSALNVEFEFALDERRYRTKRTLKRNNKGAIASTQQVFVQLKDADWEAVPDTNKKVDFDKWILQKIGFGYEIFTSSVLLLQGRSEKLLDSKPSGRFEVLAGIVDLDRYQRLHEKANQRKIALKNQLESLEAQVGTVPEVTDEQYAQALLKIAVSEQLVEDSLKKIESAHALETEARRWAEAEGRAGEAKHKAVRAETLLGEAVRIEKQFARLKELRGILPAVNAVILVRNQIGESQRVATRLTKDREEASLRKSKSEGANELAKRQRALRAKGLADDETMLHAANARLRELAGLLQVVQLAQAEESKLKTLGEQSAALPKDPEGELRTARNEETRLRELERILPILERVQTERHELATAMSAEVERKQKRDETAKLGKDAKADADKANASWHEMRFAQAQAEMAVAVAKSELLRARSALDEFKTLDGATDCRACGQPLTPSHFAQEQAKRKDELSKAEKAEKQCAESAERAIEAVRVASEKHAVLEKQIVELRDRYKDHDAAAKQAVNDVQRLRGSLDLRYAEIPTPFQKKIAETLPRNWLETTYPERDELIGLRREVGSKDAAVRRVRTAEETLQRSQDLRSRREAAEQNLTKLKQQLPSGDPVELHKEHGTLQAQETALLSRVKGAKQALEQLDREIDLAGREAHTAITHLTDLVGKLNSENEKQEIYRKHLEQRLGDLPADWRKRAEASGFVEHSEWKTELDELASAGVEAQYQQLAQARMGLEALRSEAEQLEAAAAAFPPESRRSGHEVRALITVAKQDRERSEKEFRDAQVQKERLDGYRTQRAKLGEEKLKIAAEQNRFKILAELLGKDKLQRYLVRQAERQIVQFGNAVLDRLSSGQLFMKLVGSEEGEINKALELECANRESPGAPINVAFLSGSQRFRVAVSLALAIGQYASRQHRPIESVIIDEGFGCLDRQGRQVMIQELQNLRGHLRCILLVSHQEEFADAFNDGYRFELKSGATRVERFQRGIGIRKET